MDATALVERLRRDGLRLSAAESCTGGLLSATIVDVPGASEVFLGGAICYDDKVKELLLGVESKLLAQNGAVSAAVAESMAHNVRDRTGSDLSVAITGIAGPTGGTESKPVGTVWIAALGPGEVLDVQRFVFDGDREDIRRQSVNAAIKMIQGEVDEWEKETAAT